MHRAKASCWDCADAPAFGEPPEPAEPADDGLPPQAAVSRAMLAVTARMVARRRARE
jgi:hypothetical protein